ncbi:esterase/lipase family protein, partial [Pyxidicoccus sp. 3LFB2]
ADGSDAGADGGRECGTEPSPDAGADGGSDAGSALAEALGVQASFEPMAFAAPTPVLNPVPTSAGERTGAAETARMKARCGMCEVRPRAPINPSKVPYISVHGINAGPDAMNGAINHFPSNAQVYDFFYPDNRHPMETSDCLRNAIVQVLRQHSGKTVQVVGHSLGAVVAAGADHSLADDEWMPTEVPTNCGFDVKVRGRHRPGFVLEPAPAASQLDLRMTLVDPIFQGFGDAPLFVSSCVPGLGDLTAGSALMETLNTRPTFSRQRRVFYAGVTDNKARDLTEFDSDDLELICKALRGETVRTRKFGLVNAWNAVKNLPVAGGQTLKNALGCNCSAARIRELAVQAAPRLPGDHDDVLDYVPF